LGVGAPRGPGGPKDPFLGVFEGIWGIGPPSGEGPTGPAGLLKASQLKASLLKAIGVYLSVLLLCYALRARPFGPKG